MINATTDVYCILGNPVRHSLSPIMHNAAFNYMGINAVYVAFQPQLLAPAIEALKTMDIKGASVTIPFKVDILPLCDSIDDAAVQIGSVNTLVNHAGSIKGYNTDGYGLLKALEKNNISYKNKKILIIGNGGSARAIAYTLALNGAYISICGRTINNVMQLVKDLNVRFPHIDGIHIDTLKQSATAQYEIIINTTPSGMSPHHNETPIDTQLINSYHVVVDIIYSPMNTLLLQIAKEKGCKTITGDYMLLYQACMQFELWTGSTAPFAIMHDALKNALG